MSTKRYLGRGKEYLLAPGKYVDARLRGSTSYITEENQRDRINGPAWVSFKGDIAFEQGGRSHRVEGPQRYWPDSGRTVYHIHS